VKGELGGGAGCYDVQHGEEGGAKRAGRSDWSETMRIPTEWPFQASCLHLLNVLLSHMETFIVAHERLLWSWRVSFSLTAVFTPLRETS
jgi:hypothetical protein